MDGVRVPNLGPENAKVLVVGEFPTVDDERKQRLFSGQSGEEFMKMMHEAGFLVSEVLFTTLLKVRPYSNQMKYAWTKDKKDAKQCIPEYLEDDGIYYSADLAADSEALHQLIVDTQPNIVITLGDAALWAVTKEVSITKWRGSLLTVADKHCEYKVIPTYSPSQIMKVWEWRTYAVRDLQRAKFESAFPEINYPEQRFIVSPPFKEAVDCLKQLIAKADHWKKPLRISADIETIARHIACIGIAWSKHDAICIPFMNAKSTHYFTLEEECEIIWLLFTLLRHPNVRVLGQNWSYDTQHIGRSWGFRSSLHRDTMLMQHVLFPGLPKDLGFLASMYCEFYVYWKDELTDYRTLPEDLIKFWTYNCKDCVVTFEIAGVLESLVERLGMQKQSQFIHRLNYHVITMMFRGVLINKEEKNRLSLSLLDEINMRQKEIDYLVSADAEIPSAMMKQLVFDEKKKKTVAKRIEKTNSNGELNISSNVQMKQLFYNELGQKVVLNRKTHEPTTDDNALTVFGQREPILKPLVDLISETRSIGVFLSTFVLMPLDVDGRMRCSFNAGGTETFRFSSSKNAFGSGGNLQNIPKGTEDEEKKTGFIFPNLRRLFIPDRHNGGRLVLFDVDLAGADAQVVAWEAEDEDLKAKFRSGAKIHALNAIDIYGRDAGPDGKRAPYYKKAKMGTHLSNYGGKPPTLSKALGMTIHESEMFQKRWFDMHPGIKTWHHEVENSLMTTRMVWNKFGFRRFYLDRIQGLLPQALAWIPQSTIAIVINNGLCNIAESNTSMELLLQVHDSLVGQFPNTDKYINLPKLRECLKVTVPYKDPLVIGTSIDMSEKSWGDLVSYNWDQLDIDN